MDSAVRDVFRRHFGAVPARWARAPGTLEVLGSYAEEHEGLVLAAAFDRYVSVAISPRTDGRVELVRGGESARQGLWLHRLEDSDRPAWVRSVCAVLAQLQRRRVHFSGFSAAVVDAIPGGMEAGEEVALRLAMALAVRQLFPFALTELGADLPPRRDAGGGLPPLTGKERLLLGRLCAASGPGAGPLWRYLGAMLGRAWHLVSVDCRYATVDPVPLVGEALVLCDSGDRATGSEGRLEELRAVWREAARALMAKGLRSVDLLRLRANRGRLTDRQHACVHHVVGEFQRVVYGERALREEDHRQFGHFLWDSHESAREQLGSTTPALDTLVDLARRHPACLGARMMGSGFGGGTVNVVSYHDVAGFMERMVLGYREATGRELRPLVCQAVDGVG